MKYINRYTGVAIGVNIYSQLSKGAKTNFITIREQEKPTHTIVETRSDSLSLGDGLAAAVVLPLVMVWSIFD